PQQLTVLAVLSRLAGAGRGRKQAGGGLLREQGQPGRVAHCPPERVEHELGGFVCHRALPGTPPGCGPRPRFTPGSYYPDPAQPCKARNSSFLCPRRAFMIGGVKTETNRRAVQPTSPPPPAFRGETTMATNLRRVPLATVAVGITLLAATVPGRAGQDKGEKGF